jgi:TonB family protein
MTFDSSTLCARTAAGDAELAVPALGLSLGQRRVLALLQNPFAVDELAQKHHLDPAKLERDLLRLADLRLVVLQGATFTAPVAPPTPVAMPMAPVVIGRSTRRTSGVALAFGATAILVAAGIWYGTRSHDAQSTPATSAVVATLAPPASSPTAPTPTLAAPSEQPMLPAARNANESAAIIGAPATATVLRGNNVSPPDRHVEIRPGLGQLAATSPPSGAAQSGLPGTTSKVPSSTVPVAAPATPPAIAPAVAPIAGPTAVPAARPATTSRTDAAAASPAASAPVAPPPAGATVAAPAAAEPAPPAPSVPIGQLALANPNPAARPATSAPLKAISREPPEFPKEAIADGLKSGTVTARLHVDARGKVAAVDILVAQPSRVFDRAVRKALMQWQFEPPAAGSAADVDVDVKFQRD